MRHTGVLEGQLAPLMVMKYLRKIGNIVKTSSTSPHNFKSKFDPCIGCLSMCGSDLDLKLWAEVDACIVNIANFPQNFFMAIRVLIGPLLHPKSLGAHNTPS